MMLWMSTPCMNQTPNQDIIWTFARNSSIMTVKSTKVETVLNGCSGSMKHQGWKSLLPWQGLESWQPIDKVIWKGLTKESDMMKIFAATRKSHDMSHTHFCQTCSYRTIIVALSRCTRGRTVGVIKVFFSALKLTIFAFSPRGKYPIKTVRKCKTLNTPACSKKNLFEQVRQCDTGWRNVYAGHSISSF